MSDEKKEKLTVKEAKFVQALVSGQADTAREALDLAGYNPTTERSAKVMAVTIMKRPRIQAAFNEAIKAEFPDVGRDAVRTVIDIMMNDMNHPAVRLKAVEVLAKHLGWNAPTKSASLNVKAEAQLALPGTDEEEPNE
jgi:phage terminase small subunit